MGLFDPAPISKEQKVARQIDTELRNAAVAMKRAYENVRKLIYANPAFEDEYGLVDADAIYTAFAINTSTGLSPDDLGKSARLIKASLNQFAPGTIEDDVPEAEINFGGE